MHWFAGILIGILTLFVIGMGFPLVIRAERAFGIAVWPYMLAVGLALVLASLFVGQDLPSVLVAVSGAACVWGSTEVKEQAIRAELGWFPYNPRKRRLPFADQIKKWPAPHL